MPSLSSLIVNSRWQRKLILFLLFPPLLWCAESADDATTRTLQFNDACRRCDEAAVTAALGSAAIDVNQRNERTGHTALHWAVQGPASKASARRAVVALLLEHGANANALNAQHESPLYCAITAGWDEELLTLLLEHGADINAAGGPGARQMQSHRGAPIHQAAAGLDVPLMKFLLAHQAKVSTDYNLHGDSALMAIFGSSVEWNRDQNFSSEKQRTDAYQIMTLLLDAGADIQYKNKLGQTALLWAARGNHLPCLRELLARGADLLARSSDGRGALHYAALNMGYHDRRVFEVLLSNKKLSIDQQDEKGDTPLHLAARIGNNEAVESLLLLGANAMLENKEHQIPLNVPGADSLKRPVFEMLERYSPLPQPPVPPPEIPRAPVVPRPPLREASRDLRPRMLFSS